MCRAGAKWQNKVTSDAGWQSFNVLLQAAEATEMEVQEGNVRQRELLVRFFKRQRLCWRSICVSAMYGPEMLTERFWVLVLVEIGCVVVCLCPGFL